MTIYSEPPLVLNIRPQHLNGPIMASRVLRFNRKSASCGSIVTTRLYVRVYDQFARGERLGAGNNTGFVRHHQAHRGTERDVRVVGS